MPPDYSARTAPDATPLPSGGATEYAQGHMSLEIISALKYVAKKCFQRGYADRIAGTPPPRFEQFWPYEHGRALANAAIVRGIDPTYLSRKRQAELLSELRRDGTIV